MIVTCLTCRRTVDECRNTCSSLQPMIDLLTKKLGTFTENWQVPELEASLQILTIIETERDMDKAIKKVKRIW